MNNFEFFNPTKILFGTGQITLLKEQIPQHKKVLVLYGGGSIKKNGVYEQVRSALASHLVFEFSGIEANPHFETCLKAVELIKKEKIDFLLAVGGGSVVDATKFISVATFYQNDPWDILAKENIVLEKSLPIGVVLTLPATGSEMNCFSVISKEDQKLSFGSPLVHPQFSILDPQTTLSLDSRQVGNGLVDAFVHVLEQYLTRNEGALLQDRFAESVLSTLIEVAQDSMKGDLVARSHHMWCATMALSSVFGVGVTHDWSTHMIGHELTALYGIDHARTLALVWPSLAKVQFKEKRDKLYQYGSRVWGLEGSEAEVAYEAIVRTQEFFESLAVPTKFSAYPNVKNDVGILVCSRLEKRGFTPMGENADITLSKVEQILRGIF